MSSWMTSESTLAPRGAQSKRSKKRAMGPAGKVLSSRTTTSGAAFGAAFGAALGVAVTVSDAGSALGLRATERPRATPSRPHLQCSLHRHSEQEGRRLDNTFGSPGRLVWSRHKRPAIVRHSLPLLGLAFGAIRANG